MMFLSGFFGYLNYVLWCLHHCSIGTLGSKIIGPEELPPLDPMVIELAIVRSGNKIYQIITNMILSQYSELKLSMLRRATVSGYLPLF